MVAVLLLVRNDIPNVSPEMLAPVVEEMKLAALPNSHSVLGPGVLVKLLPRLWPYVPEKP